MTHFHEIDVKNSKLALKKLKTFKKKDFQSQLLRTTRTFTSSNISYRHMNFSVYIESLLLRIKFFEKPYFIVNYSKEFIKISAKTYEIK